MKSEVGVELKGRLAFQAKEITLSEILESQEIVSPRSRDLNSLDMCSFALELHLLTCQA